MAAAVNYIDNDCEGEMNLLERKKSQRSNTDLHHLFMFGMFFTLWVGIAIHAFSAGYQPLDFQVNEKIKNEISIQLSKCRSICALFIWLAILFLGLYFIVIRFLTKYVIYTTIFLKLLLLSVLFPLALIHGVFNPVIVTIIAVSFIISGLTIYTFKQVGHRTVCTIIQETCKAMVCHPSSVVIVLVCSVLIGLVGYFSAFVIFGLLTIPKEQNNSSPKFHVDPPVYVFYLLFAFASCSLWIITLIYNIERTILYGIFSTWYQTTDKTTIPRTISFHITYTTLRYHVGTLTFGSTIFTIIQIIRTIYNSWIDLYAKFKAQKITIFCFLVVLANATSNTLVTCVNYGTNYYRSMQDSFKLLMRNPLKYAATRLMTEWIIFFGMVLIPIMTLGFASLYIVPNSDYYNVPQIPMLIIAIASMLITAVLLETFYAATTAILHCFLQDLSSEQIKRDFNDDENILIERI